MDALLPILEFLEQLAEGEIPAPKDVQEQAHRLLNDYLKATAPQEKKIKPKPPK